MRERRGAVAEDGFGADGSAAGEVVGSVMWAL
jgi:hypothetical protein